ncbi:permease [Halodesulfurarchaeum sp.]|uniref:permease n=1 Tax=Halodesulfurarchaeum sp. TaxID=1980530 RepID=UPI001BC752DA|nr:permease [Halodesulfurarchaeum sp.]
MDEEKRAKILRSWGYFGLIVAVGVGLLVLYPGHREAVFASTQSYLVEMALILPAVMVLLGLFNEWVPDDVIVRYLGEQSGVSGLGLAIVLGSTPTGPLYVALPIAADLIEKNARIANIVVFLTAWACLKLPQELVELQFLGWKFMSLRLVLTSIVAVGMGLLIEAILRAELNDPGDEPF